MIPILLRPGKDSFLVFNSNGPASRLIRQEKAYTALSRSIIQHDIFLADQSTVRQSLQDAVRRWFVWITVLIRMGIIPPGCFDLQQLIPLQFHLIHHRTSSKRTSSIASYASSSASSASVRAVTFSSSAFCDSYSSVSSARLVFSCSR